MRRPLVIAAIAAAVTATACDKISSLLGKKDADGGDAAAVTAGGGGGGGGPLSFLSSPFEGEIAMNLQNRGGAARPMLFGIKSPKVRIDASGGLAEANPAMTGEVAIIADPPAKKAYMLIAKTKTAMVIDFEKAKAARAAGTPGRPAGGAPSLDEVPKIEKLGTKEVIAGYGCENWRVSSPSKGTRADMCVAEGIKWVDLTDLGLASPEVGLAIAAADANRFPLRVISFDRQNVETMRMEATRIEKKTLDPSRFVVPPDYRVMDMSALMGGAFPGAPGAPPGLPPGLPPGFVPPKPK